jgi:hypothetical protein
MKLIVAVALAVCVGQCAAGEYGSIVLDNDDEVRSWATIVVSAAW